MLNQITQSFNLDVLELIIIDLISRYFGVILIELIHSLRDLRSTENIIN